MRLLLLLCLLCAVVNALTVTPFYGTGVTNTGSVLGTGQVDPHYVYCATSGCSTPLGSAVVTSEGAQWIGSNGGGWFETVWNSTQLIYYKNIECTLHMRADGSLVAIWVNGIQETIPGAGNSVYADITIADFNFGVNFAPSTIVFQIGGGSSSIEIQTVSCVGQDINECDANPCPPGATCTNQIGAPPICHVVNSCTVNSCGAGYVCVAPQTCMDINECATSSGACGAAATGNACVNTIGSYVCSCSSGYTPQNTVGCGANATGCNCEVTDPCNTGACGGSPNTCTIGSGDVAQCGCLAGYQDTSGSCGGSTSCACVDTNECVTNNGGCGSGGGGNTCTNTPGSFQCACATGYVSTTSCTEGGGGCGCVDVNECATSPGPCGTNNPNNPGLGNTCTNTPGSFSCGCDSGFQSTTGPTPCLGASCACADVNECAVAACGVGGNECSNTIGSYVCSCASGYSGDCSQGGSCNCQDINECAQGACPIDVTTCTNTPGSYVCNDVNECATAPGPCEAPFEVCVNEIDTGYSCEDVNLCATNNGGCSAVYSTCQNRLNQNPMCVDINECATSPGPCGVDQTCVNGNNNGYACVAINACAVSNGGCVAPMSICVAPNGTCISPDDPCASCPQGTSTCVGGECQDVNECATLDGGCKIPYQTCVNENPGFTCVDVNECATSNGGCPLVYSTCLNVDNAAPECEDINLCAVDNGGCPTPYDTCIHHTYSPPQCQNINECATQNGGCTVWQQCIDQSDASPVCITLDACALNNATCDPLFSTCQNNPAAAPTCNDINECATNNGDCPQFCLNLINSGYQCTEEAVVGNIVATPEASSPNWILIGVACGASVVGVVLAVWVWRMCRRRRSDHLDELHERIKSADVEMEDMRHPPSAVMMDVLPAPSAAAAPAAIDNPIRLSMISNDSSPGSHSPRSKKQQHPPPSPRSVLQNPGETNEPSDEELLPPVVPNGVFESVPPSLLDQNVHNLKQEFARSVPLPPVKKSFAPQHHHPPKEEGGLGPEEGAYQRPVIHKVSDSRSLNRVPSLVNDEEEPNNETNDDADEDADAPANGAASGEFRLQPQQPNHEIAAAAREQADADAMEEPAETAEGTT